MAATLIFYPCNPKSNQYEVTTRRFTINDENENFSMKCGCESRGLANVCHCIAKSATWILELVEV